MAEPTFQTLQGWLNARRPIILVDVSPRESFEQERIPGARNACVYEVTFAEQVRAITADPESTIVVYGSSARSLASRVAAEKLAAAGYLNVHDFRGGLAGWRGGGGIVEGPGTVPEPDGTPPDGTYTLDPERSEIEWVGRNLGGKHDGTLRLSAGEISVRSEAAAGGYFVVDMKSMTNRDIGDQTLRQVLIDHLCSDDFFEVAKYPEARFDLDRIEPIPQATPGRPNSTVYGRLTLKGATNHIEFAAVTGVNDAGELVAQANFDIDRTRWNVLYGSGKFFEKLGKHLVNDLVSVQLRIVARRV